MGKGQILKLWSEYVEDLLYGDWGENEVRNAARSRKHGKVTGLYRSPLKQ